jgi:membrane protein YdbS with pleckstrin-like domain
VGFDWGTEERRAAAAERGRRRWRWHGFWHDLPAFVLVLVLGWVLIGSPDLSVPSLPDVPWAAVAVVAGVVLLLVVLLVRMPRLRYRRWR